MDQNHAADLTFEVKRVGASRARDGSQGVKDEILITFDSLRTSDEIQSYARNLERRGRGLRLEINGHLWPSFPVLQTIGYILEQKNGFSKEIFSLTMIGQISRWISTLTPLGKLCTLRTLEHLSEKWENSVQIVLLCLGMRSTDCWPLGKR